MNARIIFSLFGFQIALLISANVPTVESVELVAIRGVRRAWARQANMTERLTVITNGHERHLVTWHELPEAERQWHDYLTCDEDKFSPRFVHYRRAWYDVNEFILCPDDAS
jgi:hypothetical protein